MLCALGKEIDLCVTVTLIDGLVLARSAFHHSMNYRSVVVFGRARAIESRSEKLAALRALTEHMIPGRWDEVRQPNERELQQTTVLSVPLEEASAKIRTGPPVDDDEDYDLPIWAGILPLRVTTETPVADPQMKMDVDIPGHVLAHLKPHSD
jgi:nitroimidazol reductase NimA-like FMN-containing flavoprotein (pyridoxamine 5'-phosphate oxidase superfamily)